MHFPTIIVAALAAVVSAGPVAKRQDACPQVADIPACGVTCIVNAFVQLGCGEEDYVCACSNFDSLRSAAAGCVIGACGLFGAGSVLTAAQAVCDACGTA
ncbi:hypothetical protein OQA88_2972 [Cercophora sp. LCS_1]